MSFLSNFWDLLNSPADEALDRIYHGRSRQWVAQFAPPERAPKLIAAQQVPIEPNKHYITVTAQKTVLPYDRVLLKRFYGVVHSTIIVQDDNGEPRSLTTFSGLDPGLAAIDNRAGEKLVQGPRTLLESAPFRGSAVGATIALLAVEAADYAKPLLSTLQTMSKIAGVQFFSAGVSLAEPLISGVQALSEVAGGKGTQIAYAGNLPLTAGLFLIASTDTAGFNWSEYGFASDFTLLHNGSPVSDFAYMVVTIEARTTRANWRQIPALRAAESALDAAVKAAGTKIADADSEERKKIEGALLALEWECEKTPELCPEDADRVADLARASILKHIQRASLGLAPQAAVRAVTAGGGGVSHGFSLGDVDLFPRP